MKSFLIALVMFLGLNLIYQSANAQPNPNNTLWGYFQTTASVSSQDESFDIPVARLLGKKVINKRTTLVGEYNFVTGKPQIIDVNYVVTKGIKVDAGILLTLTTYDHPGPWGVYFPSTPLLKLNPQFVDEGVMVGFTRDSFSAHLAAYNGEGVLNKNADGDVEIAGRLAAGDSLLSISLVGQAEPNGHRDYRAMFVTIGCFPKLQLNAAVAQREGNHFALHYNLIYRPSVWSVGAQFEVKSGAIDRIGGLFSIQRQLGWRSRLELNHHIVEGRAPQLELRFQQAVDFMK